MAKSDSEAEDVENGEMTIDALPTKELFIDMLTRDIGLIPAIVDLVDNCADAAKKIKGDESLRGHWARVSLSGEEFSVSDNCGGMTAETARKYAFRFGRPPGAPTVKHSVGQFGVGMKRGIFKMGRKFRVESTTRTTRFVMEVDVDDWANKPKWKFEFSELDEETKHPASDTGTIVTVTKLRPDVAEKFELDSFVTELRNELKSRLQDPISRGLATSLNGLPIDAEPLMILSHAKLAPAHKKLVYSERGKKTVTVHLYCGIGRSASRADERAEAGWYVFCNGRLILEGDKSEATGWGSDSENIEIPGFHPQYNSLRGFAYFDSDDPSRLPWNTTKTGLNLDSDIYRSAKLEMMTLMRPVIDLLNKLKDEKQEKEDAEVKGPLEKLVDAAKPVRLEDANTRPVFTPPVVSSPPRPRGPVMQRIQYDAPLDKAMKVKTELGARSWVEVGKGTFEYFYNAEVK